MRRRFPLAVGFTIIEMVVVLAIISVISTTLVLNFRTNGVGASARMQTANVIVSDIRRMQVMAISGTTYQDSNTCGFGVHYLDPTHYRLFVRLAGSVSCKTDPREWVIDAADPIIETKVLVNNKMMMSSFPDIYFELPDPTTYINNSNASANIAKIDISAISIPADKTSVTVYTSGRIDIQ